jgi:tetratricopeptide (TPR) repeat protein
VILRRDACFRAIRSAAERGGIRSALGAIEEVAQYHRGDCELLAYAPQLLGAGRADLLGHIASLHIALRRDEADGYFWLAMAIYDNVNRGVHSAQMLKQAEVHLMRALELKPNYPEAACGLCRVARARGDREGARRCFERAIARFGQDPSLHGELADLELERDPNVALAWYARAEALAPDDAEWPLGQARALARLTRFDEAEAALARARRLNPQHPRLRAVEVSLVRDQPTLRKGLSLSPVRPPTA